MFDSPCIFFISCNNTLFVTTYTNYLNNNIVTTFYCSNYQYFNFYLCVCRNIYLFCVVTSLIIVPMKTKQIIIRLSEAEKERVSKYAKRKDISISQLIRNYLRKLNTLN